MNGVRWSPHPVETYVRTVDGLKVGPGVIPALQKDLALWNLYWLSYPNLERHTDHEDGEPPVWPQLDPVLPMAVLTANQAAGAAQVRDLALYLTPAEFVTELRKRQVDHLELAKMYSTGIWLDLMEHRAALYVDEPSSQVLVPPTPAKRKLGLTKQIDGTAGPNSSNILPLSRLMSLKLH